MRKITVLVMVTILCFLLTACASKNSQDIASEELGINVSEGEEISNYDTHSGNGDGASCVTFQFSNDNLLEEIKSNPEWKSFPLDETVKTLVYGVSTETSAIGPYLNDNEGKSLVPEIQNGYYLLIDRQVEKDKALEEDILHRYSFNFTLGIYDTDTNTLYFCKLDT